MAVPIDSQDDFVVVENQISIKHIEAFQQALESTGTTGSIAQFVTLNPVMLAQWEGEGRDRWVIPRNQLGDETHVDFMLGDRLGAIVTWLAVVLADPVAIPPTAPDEAEAYLRRLAQPILDWRVWLRDHRATAVRPRREGGLGLADLEESVPGLILLGRRRDGRSRNESAREKLRQELNVAVRTYDALIEVAKRRCEYWDSWYLAMD